MENEINYEHLAVKRVLEEYGIDSVCALPEKFDDAFIGVSHSDIPMYDAHVLETLGYNPDIDGDEDCSMIVELFGDEKHLSDETLVLEPSEFLDSAIIGRVNGICKAVYDYDLLIKAFINANDGWDVEDAEDWISYNTIRAIPYMGECAPVIMFNLSYMM